MKYGINKNFIISTILFVFMFVFISTLSYGANTPDPDVSNIKSTKFKLVICDGPRYPNPLPPGITAPPEGYVPCDFAGLMLQANHFINIIIVASVIVAIVGFSYSGFLFISGTEKNRTKAKEILPKILKGFIMILTAWFIVYQILSWLTDNGNGFSKLIGG